MPDDTEELIRRGLAAGAGEEDVEIWEHGAQERAQAEAHLVERLLNLKTRMDAFERNLSDNTAATKRIETSTAAIVEAFESLRGAMNVLQTIGRIARPLSYIAMAFSAIVGLFYVVKGGPPPGGMKP